MSRPFLFLLMAGLGLAVAPIQTFAQETVFTSGNIKVQRHEQPVRDLETGWATSYKLLRDNIVFGECFTDPKLRALPTTYYHRDGPLGVVMKKWNVKSAGAEPAIAVIGMNAATVAAHAHAPQQLDFFEPNKTIIDLNERQGKDSYFTYLPDARKRGVAVRIFHGSPREQLKKQVQPKTYKIIVLEACSGEDCEKLFIDLFTREGIAECVSRLTDDGILCVHTSHRYLDLPPALAAIGKDLGLHVRCGRDTPDSERQQSVSTIGHWTSEWVMLASSTKVLDDACVLPENYTPPKWGGTEYWRMLAPCQQIWTDKGPNSVRGLLRGHPFNQRMANAISPLTDRANSVLSRFGGGPSMYLDPYVFVGLVGGSMQAYHERNDLPLSALWP